MISIMGLNHIDMKYIIIGLVYTGLIIGIHFYGKNHNVKVDSGYEMFFHKEIHEK